MFRPARLKEDLNHETAEEILAKKKYPVAQMKQCIVELIRRLKGQETFPHEIGLVSGYDSRVY